MKKCNCEVNLYILHQGVTGSCIFVSVKFPEGRRIKFIVDCGLFQEKKYEEFNLKGFPFKMEELDFIFLTHAHIDHIGRLPEAIKNNFSGKIYATYTTKILMKPLLENSLDILKQDSSTSDLYSNLDVRNCISLVRGVDYRKSIEVTPNIKVTFFENGHIPGAAIILVQILSEFGEDINLLFTGDYKPDDIFLDVPELPEWVKELPLTVITESTYGNEISNPVSSKLTFKENILKALHKQQDIMIPVLALREPRILYEFKCMQQNGEIPQNYLLGYDYSGLGKEIIQIFQKEPIHIKEEMRDFIPKGAIAIQKINRTSFMQKKNPKIIISPSGMGHYGNAGYYIVETLGNKAGLVHFTCYTCEGTLGWKLKEKKVGDSVAIGSTAIVKRGIVEYTDEFSSHAKADELELFLKQFKNIKTILINHGELSSKYALRSRLQENMNAGCHIEVLDINYYFKIGPNGLKKILQNKISSYEKP